MHALCLTLALVLSLLAASCQVAEPRLEAVDATPAPGLAAPDDVTGASRTKHLGDAPAEAEAPPAQSGTARRMVYRVSLGVEVARVEEAIESFLTAVRGMGGHLGARADGAVTVRVPAARFDDALAEARRLGRVLHQSLQANDVTKTYLDLEIRLDNARKSRERLLALLQKADKVEDILRIEEQVRRLTTEIEQAEGELKYLADQVAMSTVQVEFKAVAALVPERRRVASRFWWINQVGVERVRRDF